MPRDISNRCAGCGPRVFAARVPALAAAQPSAGRRAGCRPLARV